MVNGVPGGPIDGVITGEISQELILPRESYDISRSVSELVKPHFLAMNKEGKPVGPEGELDLVLEVDGKVKLRLKQGDKTQYLDLLGLESGTAEVAPSPSSHRL